MNNDIDVTDALDAAARRLPHRERTRRGSAATAVVLAMGGFRHLGGDWPEWTDPRRGALLEILSRRCVRRTELVRAANRLLPRVGHLMGAQASRAVSKNYLGILVRRIKADFKELVVDELARIERVEPAHDGWPRYYDLRRLMLGGRSR